MQSFTMQTPPIRQQSFPSNVILTVNSLFKLDKKISESRLAQETVQLSGIAKQQHWLHKLLHRLFVW